MNKYFVRSFHLFLGATSNICFIRIWDQMTQNSIEAIIAHINQFLAFENDLNIAQIFWPKKQSN